MCFLSDLPKFTRHPKETEQIVSFRSLSFDLLCQNTWLLFLVFSIFSVDLPSMLKFLVFQGIAKLTSIILAQSFFFPS